MFQLGSALLDACVLAVVSKGDTYGYLLTQEIRTVIEVSESTLYPVLRRLQSEQRLVTYDSPYNGRNRRYYQITPQGRQHLAYLQEDWQHFKSAVDYLLATAPEPAPPPEESPPEERPPDTADASGAAPASVNTDQASSTEDTPRGLIESSPSPTTRDKGDAQ